MRGTFSLGETMRAVCALIDRFLVSHWRWIDEHYLAEGKGRADTDRRAMVTLAVFVLMLVFLYYIVLAYGGIQRAMATELPATIGNVWPAFGEFLRNHSRLIENITWSLGCFFCYFLVPAVVIKTVFRERLRDHGLAGGGFWRHLWIYAILFAPVGILVWMVSYSDAFLQRYPFYSRPAGLTDFLVWEAFYGLQFFSLEFFFRGFVLRGLAPRIGRYAIFMMVVPYTMIHFQKPFLETLGAIVAGTVLGTLALRTKTIWGGVAIHVAVAWSMDVAAVIQKGGFVGG